MTRPFWRRLWNTERAFAFDVTLALAATACALVLGYVLPGETLPDNPTLLMSRVVLEGVVGLGLLVRRRFPVTLMSVLTVVAAVQSAVLDVGTDPLLPINIPTNPWVPGITPLAIYAVVVYAERRRLAWVLAGLLTVVAVRPWAAPNVQVIVNGLVCTVPSAILGLYVGTRRRLLQEWQERAERAEREQHLLAEQARSDERARLASEMHDVVTHRLSLMVLQSGALAVTAPDDSTRRAAEELRASGCQALEELRDLVGVLRSGQEGTAGHRDAATGSVLDLSALVARSRAAGLRVRLVEEGTSALVSPTVGRTAHRIVQEALTNVTKHAMGAEVEVHARYGDSRVRLSIRNTPPPEQIAPDLASSGSGTGLEGLRQRVDLVGGYLDTAVTTDGGFEVSAILPAFVPTGGASDESHDAGGRR